MKRPDIAIDVCRDSDSTGTPYVLVKWIDHLESRVADPLFVDGGSKCQLCGADAVHVHTAIEQTIYRNGVKTGRAQASQSDGVEHGLMAPSPPAAAERSDEGKS